MSALVPGRSVAGGRSGSFLPTGVGRVELVRHPPMEPFAEVVRGDLVRLVACAVRRS